MLPLPPFAVAFATIDRPQAVQRLIRSIRRYFPKTPVYVADQSRQVEPMASFYAAHDTTVLRMPFDAGVTASRNRLAMAIREPYFLLCDDDFVLDARTDVADALTILELRPDIGVVGGRLFDYDGYSEWVRNWELYLHHDTRHRTLTSIPIYHFAPRARDVLGIRYFLCDAVMNFAMFRTAIFDQTVRWDEQFKSNGEHEDFYLNLKLNSSVQVVHLPGLIGYHHHPEVYRKYRAVLRDRNEGWRRFFRKWEIDQHIELGLGVRTIDDVGSVLTHEQSRSRFFINPDLSLQRENADPRLLLISRTNELVPAGALGADGMAGDAAGSDGARTDRLLLDRRSHRLLVAAGAETEPPPPESRIADRYWLEASDTDEAVSTTAQRLVFRHDAVLRPAGDFYLWYRVDPSGGGNAGNPRRRLAVVVRWTAADGLILSWRSRRSFLHLDPSPWWRGVLLDVPLLPRGIGWMRFDLFTDGGRSADPVCTGFLFATADAGGAGEAPAIDVTAFSRLPQDGAAADRPGLPMEQIRRGLPTRTVTMQAAAGAPGLRLMPNQELSGLETLFFTGSAALGRALFSARLPPAALDAPGCYTLPDLSGPSALGGVFGYGSRTGLIALDLRGCGDLR